MKYLAILFISLSAFGATVYVQPNGVGTGTDFSNANALAQIPNPPVCGNVYIVAGGTYNVSDTSRVAIITGASSASPCTSSTPILIYKAVDCTATSAVYCSANWTDAFANVHASAITPQSVTGWTSSFGTSQALYVKPLGSDQEASNHVNFFGICTPYVAFDGITPTTGTPSNTSANFGFIFRNPNQKGGMISVGSGFGGNCVSSTTPITNISVRHAWFDGVDPLYGYGITSCSLSGNGTTETFTAVLTGSPSWVVGNKFDVYGTTNGSGTNIQGASATPVCGTNGTASGNCPAGTGTDFANSDHTSSSAKTLATISGNTITWTQSGAVTSDTCALNSGSNYNGYVVLDYSPNDPFATSNVSQSFASIVFSDNYLSDNGSQVDFINTTFGTFERNWQARNRVTYAQHENGFVMKDGGTYTSSGGKLCNPCTIDANIWENIGGTQVVGALGGGNNVGANVFNNLAFCTDDATAVYTYLVPQCGTSRLIGDNTGTTISSLNFIGNTCYKQTCNIQMLNAGSTGNTYQNNLFAPFNLGMDSNLGGSHTEDHNTILATSMAAGKFTDASDSVQTSGYVNPFVCGNTGTNLCQHSNSLNFQLQSTNIVPHINDGACGAGSCAAPFNVDLLGVNRQTSRGAYQFATVASSYTVTAAGAGNGSGTIVGSNGSVMNCTWNGSTTSGTCSESITAGNSVTYTMTATSGSFTGVSGGGCNASPCTITVNAPVTITATFQLGVTCSLVCPNNVANGATETCTGTLSGLSGAGSAWYVLDPNSVEILFCGYPYGNCNANGTTGSLPYSVSGLYSLNAISNGVSCTASTQPINIATPTAGSKAH